MTPITATSTHLGLVANTPDGLALINDARKLLRGTGLKIVARGRNPDRMQFVDAGRIYRSDIRRDVPRSMATHFHLYLHNSTNRGYPTEVQFAFAKGILAAVQKIYAVHNPKVFVKA